MVKLKKKKTVEVEAKTIAFHAKCCDSFDANLFDQDGVVIGTYEGYVPKFFPGQHYGDSVEMEIELDTGRILNWTVPTAAELEAILGEDEEDD